jgi:caffeoyl-CoA O-methyltransferase
MKTRSDYIRGLFAPETENLRSLRGSLKDDISVLPEEGKLLQFLIRLSGAKKIVEIGTFAGYSTLWMAAALPADGHIHTIEKDPARAAEARKNLQDRKNVTLTEGNALDILPGLTGPFDMVFIDADKLSYLHYLDWAEKNVRQGGLIVGDNTFLFDAVWKDAPIDRVRETARQAMREFNKRLSDPARYCSIMLDTPEGMTIAQKIF